MKKSIKEIKLHRETYVDKIVEVIEEQILSGKLFPNSKISELQIAKEFGVSRAPAREALNRLEDMGLVEKDYQGRKIKALNLNEFKEIYELRIIVEAYCAMQACLNASKEDHEVLKNIRDQMEESLISKNKKKLRELSMKFHDHMIKCSKNNTLLEVYRLQANKVRWASSFVLDLPNRPKQDFKEHNQLLDALIKRDAKKVRVLMEKHQKRIMEIVLNHFRRNIYIDR